MNRLISKLTLPAVLSAAVVAAATLLSPSQASAQSGNTVPVQGDITGKVTWRKKKQYVLQGGVFVKPGARLTIKPGTQIYGTPGSFLVIERGAKIIAKGTASKPIVFTSSKNAGERRPGDWGGLLILGAAPVNRCPAGDCAPEGLPPGTQFGGSNAQDSSGTLQYVRVEFAGFELSPGNELNAITFSGVGSGTTVDHIQANQGLDDAIEMFGGTVNLKYAVASSFDDDGFDWQLGWSGKAQFVVIQQQAEGSTSKTERGIEADNSEFNTDANPRSAPQLANFTLVGEQDDSLPGTGGEGIELRRGTAGQLRNFIVQDFKKVGVRISDNEGSTSTRSQFESGALDLQGFILFNNNNGTNLSGNTATLFDVKGLSAMKIYTELNPQLADPHARGQQPDFRPAVGSPALDPARAAASFNDGFFTAASYLGAFNGTDNWINGWTSWVTE